MHEEKKTRNSDHRFDGVYNAVRHKSTTFIESQEREQEKNREKTSAETTSTTKKTMGDDDATVEMIPSNFSRM